MEALLVLRTRQIPLTDDLIVDGAGVVDPKLLLFAKVFRLMHVLQMESNYNLMEKLFSQIVLTADEWELNFLGHVTKLW